MCEVDHDCGKIGEYESIILDEKGEYRLYMEDCVSAPIKFCPYCGSELIADPDEVKTLIEQKESERKRQHENVIETNRLFDEILSKPLPERQPEPDDLDDDDWNPFIKQKKSP